MAFPPPFSFVIPWDHNGRCRVEVNGRTFDVNHCYMPCYNKPWFRGSVEGREVAIRQKFTSLLRALAKIPV